MEFSNARSSRKRNEETLPWAKASQHSISNCATKQPSFWMKSEKKKKIWQWSDCSPSTSNPTISNPSMSCAGKGRHRLGLPQVAGNPKGKGEGTHCFQETKSPRQDRSHHDLSSPNKEGGWARRYSPVSFVQRTQSQQHGSVSCFLSNHLPTTRKTTEVCQESAIFWISK